MSMCNEVYIHARMCAHKCYSPDYKLYSLGIVTFIFSIYYTSTVSSIG